MSEGTLLSVRGEAWRTVAPDYATVHCLLTAVAASKPESLGLLRQAQNAIVSALHQLGGTALTVETQRAALTWSLQTVGTYDEQDFNKATGVHGPTGRVVASAELMVAVRDLALLIDIGKALAEVNGLHLNGVGWGVDRDNPAWQSVRADAIAAAIAKGRDYATALGGSLRSVEHVADVGLLAGDSTEQSAVARSFGRRAMAAHLDETASTPSLDPVPQDLNAVVEARLIAQVPPLPSDAG